MRLRTDSVETHYTIEGDGPWVTLSHSLACDLSMWDEQAKLLRRKYRVLRYDTRGHGASSAPAGAYTLEALAEDACHLFAALGVKRTHWVGLSLGGMIGQAFALKYPGMFESLVLADTTSRYPTEAAPAWQERIRAVQARGMEAVLDATLARWFTGPFRAARKDVTARVAAMIRGTPVAGYVGCCHAIPRINLTHRLREIKCPVLVIVGEQDAGTPVAMAQEIHEALPGSGLVILPSASHLSNIEQPEAFNAALSAFLDRVSGR